MPVLMHERKTYGCFSHGLSFPSKVRLPVRTAWPGRQRGSPRDPRFAALFNDWVNEYAKSAAVLPYLVFAEVEAAPLAVRGADDGTSAAGGGGGGGTVTNQEKFCEASAGTNVEMRTGAQPSQDRAAGHDARTTGTT